MQERGVNVYRISNSAIEKKTGKTWDEWVMAVEGIENFPESRPKRVEMIRMKFNVNEWWAQAILNRYEWERGIRKSS